MATRLKPFSIYVDYSSAIRKRIQASSHSEIEFGSPDPFDFNSHNMDMANVQYIGGGAIISMSGISKG